MYSGGAIFDSYSFYCRRQWLEWKEACVEARPGHAQYVWLFYLYICLSLSQNINIGIINQWQNEYAIINEMAVSIVMKYQLMAGVISSGISYVR